MAHIRALFFDVDDTLYSTSRFSERARRAALDAMIALGLRADAEALYRELREVIEEFSPNSSSHFDKLLLRLDPACRAGINPALLVAAGVVAYREVKTRDLAPFPGVYAALEALARTTLIRGIITQGATFQQAEKIVRLGIHRYLTPDAIFISDQLGISKPNVKIFRRALDAVGVTPAEAVYVGDNPVMDIDPPNALGMVTIRYCGPGKHADVLGTTRPDFEIRTFPELLDVLRDALGIAV
ncbi:MAG: HAD-IA family hydrolase [Planctomycetes bacterium]|nr:HAD-IA family hydrolase [Planctomycetota bacterium]